MNIKNNVENIFEALPGFCEVSTSLMRKNVWTKRFGVACAFVVKFQLFLNMSTPNGPSFRLPNTT
jgi:hypothetical protein